MALDLRPLTLGELLDRGFTMYRRNLWLFVGIAAVPAVLALALALLVQVMQMKTLDTALAARSQPGPPAFDPESIMTIMSLVGGILVLALAYWVVYMVALGATTFAVSELYVGRAVTIRDVYGKMSDRIGALVFLMILIGLRLFGIFLGAGIMMALVVGLAGLLSPIAAAIAGAVSLVGFAAIGLLCFYMVLRYAVAVPALVIERLTARSSILRSIELTRGRLGRVFLLVLCATMVTYATVAIFQGPFMIGSMMAEPGTQRWLWFSVAGSVVGTIGAAFTTPFLIIGLALIYYDARIRDEGLDLELTLAALDTPARA
jgi:hypothetical protein